jgi:uncharacterized coiled-coil DUF342 family protein
MDRGDKTEHDRLIAASRALRTKSDELIASAKETIDRAKAIIKRREALLHPATVPSE